MTGMRIISYTASPTLLIIGDSTRYDVAVLVFTLRPVAIVFSYYWGPWTVMLRPSDLKSYYYIDNLFQPYSQEPSKMKVGNTVRILPSYERSH